MQKLLREGTAPVESLEARRLLSFSLTNKVLAVAGTSGDDGITLSLSSGELKLSDNGATKKFAVTSITNITIDAGAGFDTILVSPRIKLPCAISGGKGNDS